MDLKDYLDSTALQVDRLINRYFGNVAGELGKASAHLLLAGGKRFRPALLLLSADSVRKGSSIDVMPAALALELTHSFTLIHDDIMDADAFRRGVPTVHTQWDEPTAILAGDVIFATAFEFIAMADTPDHAKVRAVSMLARTCVEICEGQHMDISFESRGDVLEGEYLTMVEKKTGVLYASAAGIGAILAGGKPAHADALYAFGKGIGMAFQIQDDIIDLMAPSKVSGKDRASDLREGKKTLISIKAKEKGLDLESYQKPLTNTEIDDVIGQIEESGVLTEVRDMARGLISMGKQRIAILPASEEKQLLMDLADHFLARSF
jgi:geranylgeranyl diphosphate synthase type I